MKRILLCMTIVVFLMIPAVALSPAGQSIVTRVYAQGGSTDFLYTCQPGVISKDCNPPTLQQIEFTAVRLIYVLWGFTGVIFTVLMIYNGAMYMTSAGDEEKIRESRQRMVQWLIGIFLVFLSLPIVGTIMKIFIGDTPCYGRLQDPGFTFFFPDVCTSGDAPIVAPSGSPAPTPTP